MNESAISIPDDRGAEYGRSLGELERAGDFELGRGDVISSIDINSAPGDFPVYSSSAVGEGVFGRYGRFMFDEELITWSIDGGGRPFHRPKHKFSVTNVCGYLRILRSDRWKYRYLQAVLENAHSGIQFDYQAKAHPSVIRDLYSLRWIPIDEQQAIGSILDTLDTAIRQTEAIIEKLKQVKQGLLHDLLTRGIDENGELRPPQSEAPHLYKQSVLGWLPRTWDTQSLRELTSTDITYGIVQAGPHVDGGVPYIRTGDMAGESLDRSQLLCTSRRIAEAYRRSEVRAGEIVMAIRATVGKVLPVPQELDGANLTQGTARIAPSGEIDAIFLLWALRSLRTRRALLNEVKGTTFAEITLQALREIRIAVPANKEEQTDIGLRLRGYENRIHEEERYRGKLKHQKLGVMSDLLTGRVRVTPLLNSDSDPSTVNC